MNNIYVTSPLLPDIEKFKNCIDEICESKFLTNNGKFLQKFEQSLANYLGVEYVSVFTNGTFPLVAALKAFDIQGEVITTPYSFIATSNVLKLLGLEPVFVDVDEFGNIDPDKIECAITERTSAVLAVHVYGNPCQTERLENICGKHNLKLIYDAAHAFGVEVNGKSILLEGDMSALSFHATKVFNTLEGGALICHSAEMKRRIDVFRNFGIEDEVHVSDFGINCKMDELRAAWGLLNLEKVDDAIIARKQVAMYYRDALRDVNGISFFDDIAEVRHNHSYFPIFVGNGYGMSRDDLYETLKSHGIFARRYFYPLITDYAIYSDCKREALTNARKLADSVLCLPISHEINEITIKDIVKWIK